MADTLLRSYSYHPMRLHSFHQLLYDQLMPWLPENNRVLFYRAWQHHVAAASSSTYLHGLITVFERNNRGLPPALKEEWQFIGHTKFTPLIKEIYFGLKSQELTGLKLFFYRDLIAQAFAHSYVFCELQLAGLSAVRRQFELRQLMRRLDDLLQYSKITFKKKEGEDALIVYMVHLCMLIFRRLLSNKYHNILTPDIVLLNNELIKPYYHSDYPQGHLLITLYNWYEKDFPNIIDKFAGGGGLFSDSKSQPVKSNKNALINQESQSVAIDDADKPKAEEQEMQSLTSNKVAAKTTLSYSTAEASKILGISPNGLLKQAKQGKIRHYRIGKLYKFYQQEIIAIMHGKN
ncbi:MAG: helix-turn-helix domain-containing protein [Bacteroidales bacterium]|nr:helix-turn-helix domain-containing protein [Bacteroidales bacterium]